MDDLPPLIVTLAGESDSYEAMMDAAVAQATADAASMEKALKHATESMLDDLRLQANTFGLTTREVEIYKLEMQGASQEQIEMARSMNRAISAMEREEEEFRQIMKAEREAEQAALDLANAQQKAWGSFMGLDNIGKQIRDIGRTLTLYVTTAVVALGAVSVNEFAKFDSALTETKAITGQVSPEIQKQMENIVFSISEMSRFSPDELMFGLKGLAAAGLTVEQSMKSLGVVERFAVAGAFDLERATSLLTDSQAAMGLAVKDATQNQLNMIRVSDALVKAGDQSTASPEQFAEALANGAADAKMWGAEIETVMALLDAYASKGNKGAAAGSDMARSMKLMKTAYMEHADVFKKANIEVADSNGNYKNFIDVIADLEDAMKGMSGTEVTGFLKSLGFEALAQNAITPLIGMSQQMREWEQAQKEATGYTKNVAETQMQSFTNEVKMLWNQLKIISIEIGRELIPYIKDLSKWVAYGIDVWKSWTPEMKQTAMAVSVFLAGLGPLLVGLGSMVVLIGQVQTSMISLGMIQSGVTIGTLAWNAATLGIVGAASVAIFELIGLRKAYNELNAAQEGAIKNQEQHINMLNKMATAEIAAANKDPNKTEKLTKGLAQAQRMVEDYGAAVQAAHSRVDSIGFLNYDFGEAKKELKQYEGLLQNAKDRVEMYKKALDVSPKVELPMSPKQQMDDQLIDDIETLTNKLETQKNTFGMTGHEIAFYTLQLKGATEEQLQVARASAEAIKQLEEQNRVVEKRRGFDEEIKRMQQEVMWAGVSARQQKILQAATEGATEAQLQSMRSIDKQATAIEAQKKQYDEAASMLKKYENPLTRVKEEQAALADAFINGLIPVDVFNRGMEETQKSVKNEVRVRFKMEGIDAVEAGTAEAMAKIESFRMKTKEPIKADIESVKHQVLAEAKGRQAQNELVAQQQVVPKKLHPAKLTGGALRAQEPTNNIAVQPENTKDTLTKSLQAANTRLESLLTQIATNTTPEQGMGNTLTIRKVRLQKG